MKFRVRGGGVKLTVILYSIDSENPLGSYRVKETYGLRIEGLYFHVSRQGKGLSTVQQRAEKLSKG